MQQLRKQVADAIRSHRRIKTLLKEKITSLEQNQNIKPLGSNAFTIQLSELNKHGNWSPQFYDFRQQYKHLCKVIDKTELPNLPKKLSEIIKNGKAEISNYTGGFKRSYEFKFHPEVIAKLKELLENN